MKRESTSTEVGSFFLWHSDSSQSEKEQVKLNGEYKCAWHCDLEN